MVVRRIGKALFHDDLTAAAVLPRLRAGRLLACSIQKLLMLVPMQGATHFCARALGPQLATLATALGHIIFPSPFLTVQAAGDHHLAGRAKITVVFWPVCKS